MKPFSNRCVSHFHVDFYLSIFPSLSALVLNMVAESTSKQCPELKRMFIFAKSPYKSQTVAAEVRWNRIQDSIARNPNFTFLVPRIFTAYAESTFPYEFFVDGRSTEAALDMTTARSFFQNATFPQDFYRRNGTFGFLNIGPEINALSQAHPIETGANQGVGNYVPDPSDPGLQGGVRQFLNCTWTGC